MKSLSSSPLAMHAFFLFALNLAVGTTSAYAQWNVLDVSYLYPLPLTAESSENLRPDDQHAKGPLFPEILYQRMAPAVRSIFAANERSRLRVVGVRIDPCGLDEKAETCLPEVRMVWQPLKENTQPTSAEDGAFHTFYRLSPEEFRALVREIAVLKRINESAGLRTDHLPLTVHPGFLSKNTPRFREALRKIWLTYCGEKNLVQVTVIREETPAFWHRFEALHLKEGEWKPQAIPRISKVNAEITAQDYFNDSLGIPRSGSEASHQMKVSNVPAYFGEDSLEKSLQGYHAPRESDRPIFTEAVRVTHRLDNPRAFHTGNMDCVHCHLAEPARFYFKHHLSGLESTSSRWDRYRVPGPWKTQTRKVTAAGKSTRVLRAFGYYFDQPVVNTRVIHESIEVAARLQKQYPSLPRVIE